MSKRAISRDDIMSLDAYEKVRDQRRAAVTALKRNRRISVGPDVTFYFENFDTIWHQIHEMLRIEKGGEAQVEDELSAYAPLIPDGTNLVATMMIEIEEPARRARVLAGLGGIEETLSLSFDGATVAAVPEGDVERTTEEGKTSSVHFVKFPFTPEQARAFRRPGTRAVLAVAHPNYDHMAALPEPVREALAADLDDQ
ncbi:MAG: DUF3501 family protein [Rhodospirillales bacterium]|nr:MAG: DUF3501 family protein [Rhodospirillales bacterium]